MEDSAITPGALDSLGEHLALAVKHAPLPGSQGSWDTHARRADLLCRAPTIRPAFRRAAFDFGNR